MNVKASKGSPEWISSLINDISGACSVMTNPVGAIQNLIQNNPKYQELKGIPEQAQKYVEENGGNPEDAFRQYASSMGINPDNFIGIVQRFIH